MTPLCDPKGKRCIASVETCTTIRYIFDYTPISCKGSESVRIAKSSLFTVTIRSPSGNGRMINGSTFPKSPFDETEYLADHDTILKENRCFPLKKRLTFRCDVTVDFPVYKTADTSFVTCEGGVKIWLAGSINTGEMDGKYASAAQLAFHRSESAMRLCDMLHNR